MPNDAGHVVLLVQSHDDSREMYSEYLRHSGLAAIAASNAADALTVAPMADVIVTGIRLDGGIDGIELIARLREDARTKHVPIVVLTAFAMQSDRERAERAGCDVFLPKPCLPEDLLREVRRVLAPLKVSVVRARRVMRPVANESRRKKRL
jgi:CheY-like chemotaxis protein